MLLITTPNNFLKTFLKLINQYDHLYISVAWASVNNPVSDHLIQNKHKITKAVIGTHFYQTHPDFMREFIQSKNVQFILNPEGIFHPKAYFFVNDNSEWECLIGSANLTNNALANNSEIMVHISNKDQDSNFIYDSFMKILTEYWNSSEPLSASDFEVYLEYWKKQSRRIKNLSGKYGGTKVNKPPINIELLRKTWSEYVELVKKDIHHGIDDRFKILNLAKETFDKHSNFSAIDLNQRKRIAGFSWDDNNPWGWFGSMKGAGVFKNRVIENDENISIALDQIPSVGAIERVHYLNYINNFINAFPNGRHGIAVASRLLAMKRPDYFVCFDNQNKDGICSEFKIKKSHISYETYWDDIIERILDSVWWSTLEPKNEFESNIWKGRVALIDTIYYKPRA